MRKNLSQITLDDRAVMIRGSRFMEAPEEQRAAIVIEHVLQDEQMPEDERETGIRLASQAIAYRILSFSVVLSALIFWIISLVHPILNPLAIFEISANAAVWLGALGIVLPSMIRMWTQPDLGSL